MRTILKGAVAVALLATSAATPVLAQSGPVLTVDMEKLLSDSLAAKSAAAQLQTQFSAPQTQINTELQAANTALQTQETAVRTALGGTQDVSKIPPATRTAFDQAQQRFANARQQAAQLSQAVQELQGYYRDQIVQAVLPLAEALRNERKASAVVPRGSVLAADPAGDVTATLLPRLDAALKTVTPPPQQAAPAAAGAAPAAPAAAAPATPRPQPRGR
jgi:Skp family chaperone for outer membrane proteins